MLSGRGLCNELITRPEESYRLWCVVVCDLEASRICAPYIYDIRSLRVNDLIIINSRLFRFQTSAYRHIYIYIYMLENSLPHVSEIL